MHEAAGILEVYGCVAAIVAADAAAKAANVRVEALDKNKPAHAETLPVPLIMCLKIRGSVSDVQVALDAAEAAAKSLTGVVTKHMISGPTTDCEKMLRINVF